MKSITKIIFSIVAMLLYISSIAQIKNIKTETVTISGNCGMCKSTIEKAGNKKKVAKVDWNKDSKIATLTFDSKATNQDEILKRIALAGYDNEKYLAPNDAYVKLLECCKYERRKISSASVKPTEELALQDTIQKQNVSPLLEVYAAYFALKDALVMNDGNAARNKANELFNAIAKVSMGQLTSEEHTVWMKYKTTLSEDVEAINGTARIEQQREHLILLSKNMFEIMKVIKPTYPVYFDHCPMYNNGKGGDWISKEAVIKNPFYGNQMLSCGKTVETIK